MNKTERISGPVPRLMGGHSVAFGTDQFTSVQKLTEGGFATIFIARQGDQRKALKVAPNVICHRKHRSSLVTVGDVLCFLQVQTPPHEWEVAVVEELHSRLQVNGFHILVSVTRTHMHDFILPPSSSSSVFILYAN